MMPGTIETRRCPNCEKEMLVILNEHGNHEYFDIRYTRVLVKKDDPTPDQRVYGCEDSAYRVEHAHMNHLATCLKQRMANR